mgnify:FL=1
MVGMRNGVVDMEDKINEALLVKKDNFKIDEINIIFDEIIQSLDTSDFIRANLIDVQRKNGFKVSLDVFKRIREAIRNEKIVYGTVTLDIKDKEICYGKQIFDKGVVLAITDGDVYTNFELILRNLLAYNTVIFEDNGYMIGTNGFVFRIVRSVLEKYGYGANLIQWTNLDLEFADFANVDLVICVGSHFIQRKVLERSKSETLVSGYNYFDIYIESDKHMDFIRKIVSLNLNLNLYVKEGIKNDFDNVIWVSDLDEAIGQINYNGNGFSTAIFTDDNAAASKFIKEVKSSIIVVNTSPSIERILDIRQSNLVRFKSIIYPSD